MEEADEKELKISLVKAREKQINVLAEKLQDDCHNVVSEVMKAKQGASCQDVTNVWMFHKLAELQLKIKELEDGKK